MADAMDVSEPLLRFDVAGPVFIPPSESPAQTLLFSVLRPMNRDNAAQILRNGQQFLVLPEDLCPPGPATTRFLGRLFHHLSGNDLERLDYLQIVYNLASLNETMRLLYAANRSWSRVLLPAGDHLAACRDALANAQPILRAIAEMASMPMEADDDGEDSNSSDDDDGDDQMDTSGLDDTPVTMDAKTVPCPAIAIWATLLNKFAQHAQSYLARVPDHPRKLPPESQIEQLEKHMKRYGREIRRMQSLPELRLSPTLDYGTRWASETQRMSYIDACDVQNPLAFTSDEDIHVRAGLMIIEVACNMMRALQTLVVGALGKYIVYRMCIEATPEMRVLWISLFMPVGMDRPDRMLSTWQGRRSEVTQLPVSSRTRSQHEGEVVEDQETRLCLPSEHEWTLHHSQDWRDTRVLPARLCAFFDFQPSAVRPNGIVKLPYPIDGFWDMTIMNILNTPFLNAQLSAIVYPAIVHQTWSDIHVHAIPYAFGTQTTPPDFPALHQAFVQELDSTIKTYPKLGHSCILSPLDLTSQGGDGASTAAIAPAETTAFRAASFGVPPPGTTDDDHKRNDAHVYSILTPPSRSNEIGVPMKAATVWQSIGDLTLDANTKNTWLLWYQVWLLAKQLNAYCQDASTYSRPLPGAAAGANLHIHYYANAVFRLMTDAMKVLVSRPSPTRFLLEQVIGEEYSAIRSIFTPGTENTTSTAAILASFSSSLTTEWEGLFGQAYNTPQNNTFDRLLRGQEVFNIARHVTAVSLMVVELCFYIASSIRPRPQGQAPLVPPIQLPDNLHVLLERIRDLPAKWEKTANVWVAYQENALWHRNIMFCAQTLYQRLKDPGPNPTLAHDLLLGRLTDTSNATNLFYLPPALNPSPSDEIYSFGIDNNMLKGYLTRAEQLHRFSRANAQGAIGAVLLPSIVNDPTASASHLARHTRVGTFLGQAHLAVHWATAVASPILSGLHAMYTRQLNLQSVLPAALAFMHIISYTATRADTRSLGAVLTPRLADAILSANNASGNFASSPNAQFVPTAQAQSDWSYVMQNDIYTPTGIDVEATIIRTNSTMYQYAFAPFMLGSPLQFDDETLQGVPLKQLVPNLPESTWATQLPAYRYLSYLSLLQLGVLGTWGVYNAVRYVNAVYIQKHDNQRSRANHRRILSMQLFGTDARRAAACFFSSVISASIHTAMIRFVVHAGNKVLPSILAELAKADWTGITALIGLVAVGSLVAYGLYRIVRPAIDQQRVGAALEAAQEMAPSGQAIVGVASKTATLAIGATGTAVRVAAGTSWWFKLWLFGTYPVRKLIQLFGWVSPAAALLLNGASWGIGTLFDIVTRPIIYTTNLVTGYIPPTFQNTAIDPLLGVLKNAGVTILSWVTQLSSHLLALIALQNLKVVLKKVWEFGDDRAKNEKIWPVLAFPVSLVSSYVVAYALAEGTNLALSYL